VLFIIYKEKDEMTTSARKKKIQGMLFVYNHGNGMPGRGGAGKYDI